LQKEMNIRESRAPLGKGRYRTKDHLQLSRGKGCGRVVENVREEGSGLGGRKEGD